ncbi:MAG: apolipoprotein N-acyltransferase, partial [Kiritimatiellia bacterium]
MTERRLINAAPVDLGARIIITLISALALAFVAPPMNLHWLQWAIYIPMFWVLRPTAERIPPNRWFLRSDTWLALLYGIVAEGAIFSWVVETIDRFSHLGTFAAVGILTLFSIVFGLPYVLMWWGLPTIRRRFGTWWVLAFPAMLVVIEFASMQLLLFPYTQGVAQYRMPSTFQLVSVTGLWGVSYLVMLVNCAFAEGIYRWREGREPPLIWIGVALGSWGAVNLFGVVRYNMVESQLQDAPVLRVAQIQDDIDMLDRMNAYPCETWNFWQGQTEKLAPGSVDLIVWPEGASVYPLNKPWRARDYKNAPCKDIDQPMERLKELAKKLDAEFLVGGTAIEISPTPGKPSANTRTAYNSVYHVLPDGTTSRYDKLVPLPFGEYMPFADSLPWLAKLVKGPGRFGAGEQAVVFEGKARIATPIC